MAAPLECACRWQLLHVSMQVLTPLTRCSVSCSPARLRSLEACGIDAVTDRVMRSVSSQASLEELTLRRCVPCWRCSEGGGSSCCVWSCPVQLLLPLRARIVDTAINIPSCHSPPQWLLADAGGAPQPARPLQPLGAARVVVPRDIRLTRGAAAGGARPRRRFGRRCCGSRRAPRCCRCGGGGVSSSRGQAAAGGARPRCAAC